MKALSIDASRMTPLASVEYLIVHTQGSPTGSHGSAQAVHDYHRSPVQDGGRGWAAIGYHVFIERDGTPVRGRPDAAMGAGVTGINSRSLHVCCSGNGDMEPFNDAQMGTLIDQLATWALEYRVPASRVIGHREAYSIEGVPDTGKSCPGAKVSMDEIREKVGSAILDRVRWPEPEVTPALKIPELPHTEPLTARSVFVPEPEKPVKEGRKTSEFVVTVLTVLGSIGVATGVLSPGDSDALVQAAASVATAIASVGYAIARMRIKLGR